MSDLGSLDEQQACYDARAPEYDDWWERRGRYHLGDEHDVLWAGEIEQLRVWLRGFGPLGRVLEFAAGTGNWTRELVGVADTVVAVDGSAERFEIVKHYWHPDELHADALRHGIDLQVGETRHHFLHAHGHPLEEEHR